MKSLSHALAAAALFTVLFAADAGAATLRVSTADDGGPGSLRQAIIDANASAGPDTIDFDIAGPAPHRVELESALPEVTDAVTIDGSTQPGYSDVPLIELRAGAALGNAFGLWITAGPSTVRGLAVGGFGAGIVFERAGAGVVEGCHVGLDAAGTTPLRNAYGGIWVLASPNSRIGGPSRAQRNVLSANGGYILNADIKGGGVHVEESDGTTVRGNFIGTDVTGERPLGNVLAGVHVRRSSVVVGGTEAEGNVIAFNLGPGVVGRDSSPLTVLSNSIFGNAPPPDRPTGPTGIWYAVVSFSPAPRLTLVGDVSGGTAVEGLLWTAFASETVRVQVFRNPACEPNGTGQGRRLAGELEAVVGANGLARFSGQLPIALAAGETLTATVTRPGGRTSPFSNCVGDTGGCRLPSFEVQPASRSVRAGEFVTFTSEARGSEPLRYQWSRQEGSTWMPIAGATSPGVTVRAEGDRGGVRVDVTNGCGADASGASYTTCTAAPAIHDQPTSVVAAAGATVTFQVYSDTFGFVDYTWYEGERGDTSRPLSTITDFGRLTLTRVEATRRLWARVSNGCGSTDSDAVTLEVVPAPAITGVRLRTKAGGKAELVISGQNFLPGTVVYVGREQLATFRKAPKVGPTAIVQKGKLEDGRPLLAAFPTGQEVDVRIVQPGVLGSLRTYKFTR